MSGFVVPTNLRAGLAAFPSADGPAWVARLPALVDEAAARWSLRLGPPFDPGGHSAWVAPARGPDGADLVLKIPRPHDEARDEAEALRLWDGAGAVRLRAADPAAGALLLERCRPGGELRARPEPEQDVVIARILRRLWVTPPPGHLFRPLAQMCDAWAAGFDAAWAAGGEALAARFDPGLARAGTDRLRSLPRTADRAVLLCTDLHAANVLAAEREPWLAIDPKPYVGDPAYDLVQHLLNCGDRVRADADGTARRVADLAGVDADRVRAWLFARLVQSVPGPEWPWAGEVARDLARRLD